MDICVVSSGSSGNATYVRFANTAVLIDGGISLKELARRMATAGLRAEDIDAVLVSHGHNDHVRGVPVICRRLGIPVYANRATLAETGLAASVGGAGAVDFVTGEEFELGDLRIRPFPVPHDAAEPVGFVISHRGARACLATDLGSVTMEVVRAFTGCDAVVLESNHDEAMLFEGPYPEFLKRRVAGPNGHLSNEDAAGLLRGVAHGGLRHIVMAHLSRTNNTPELSLEAAERALGARCGAIEIHLARQDRAGALLTVG